MREPQSQGQGQGQKDPELPGRAEQKGGWVGEDRTEIRHGADADENQERKELIRDAHVVDRSKESFLSHEVGQGNVDQDASEADGNQKQWLAVLLDPEIQEAESYDNHDDTAPVEVQKST